jgi:hypothetical protein
MGRAPNSSISLRVTEGERSASPAATTLIASSSSSAPASAEISYGTFRPTFVVTPRRSPVLAAKLLISALVGLAFGLLAEGLMTADASIGFAGPRNRQPTHCWRLRAAADPGGAAAAAFGPGSVYGWAR